MPKILVATEKPFANEAREKIKEIAHAHASTSLRFLESYASPEELLSNLKDAEALIVRSDKITETIINEASDLRIIVRAGSGYDNIDLASATARDIVVMNTPGQNANAVAELAFGMMLHMVRGGFNGNSGSELKAKHLGLHGYGNIGRCMARIAKGFDMKVRAFDPYVTETINGVELLDAEQDLYASSDFISLSIPANTDTTQSIGYELLSSCSDKLVLVNTARKEIIDEDGLLKIMEEKQGFRYCSDISPDQREIFLSKFGERCLFTTKKMGAQTGESNINAGVAAVRQVLAYFETGNTTYQVN